MHRGADGQSTPAGSSAETAAEPRTGSTHGVGEEYYQMRQVITRHAAVVAAVIFGAGTLVASACDQGFAPNSLAGIQYGTPVAFGKGIARTFVTLDDKGVPVSLGLTLSDAALTNLPTTPLMQGVPTALMVNLPMPASAQATGFDHATVDWNPMGHEPQQIYGVPHFDFHFYMISPAAQASILPSDPQFVQKLARQPAAQFRPADYIEIPGGVPMMGAHWVDPTAAEFNGHPFENSFIYGSYDGQFIFLESMISKAYLESHPNATMSVKQAQAVATAGYYPVTSAVAYDAAAKEYRITFGDLKKR